MSKVQSRTDWTTFGPWTLDFGLSHCRAGAGAVAARGNFYRYQIMLRTRAMSKLSQTLAKIIETLALPENVTLTVDIDPVSLG